MSNNLVNKKQNESAIYQNQQNEFLQSKYKESQEREMNLKNLNENLMTALNELNKENEQNLKKQLAKELEICNKRKELEIEALKKKYDDENIRLSEKNVFLENNYKELESSSKFSTKEFTQNLGLCRQTIKTYETDIENYKFLLERTNEDFKRFKNNSDDEIKLQVTNLYKEIEKLKENNEIEKINLKKNEENQRKELSLTFEKEVNFYKTKIAELSNEKTGLMKNHEKTCQLYEEYKFKLNMEIEELKIQLETAYKTKDTIVISNSKYKESQRAVVQKYEREIGGLKEMLKTEGEENKKLKFKIIESQNKIKALELEEKKLKTLLNEKNMTQEDEKNELKKQLKYEKIKSDRMQDFASQLKDEFSKKQAQLIECTLEKDEEIKKLHNIIYRLKINSSNNASKTTPLKTTLNRTADHTPPPPVHIPPLEHLPSTSRDCSRKFDTTERDFYSPRIAENSPRIEKCLSETLVQKEEGRREDGGGRMMKGGRQREEEGGKMDERKKGGTLEEEGWRREDSRREGKREEEGWRREEEERREEDAWCREERRIEDQGGRMKGEGGKMEIRKEEEGRREEGGMRVEGGGKKEKRRQDELRREGSMTTMTGKRRKSRVVSCTINMTLEGFDSCRRNLNEMEVMKEERESSFDRRFQMEPKYYNPKINHMRCESLKMNGIYQVSKIDLNKESANSSSISNNLPSTDSPVNTKMSQFIAKNNVPYKTRLSFAKK